MSKNSKSENTTTEVTEENKSEKKSSKVGSFMKKAFGVGIAVGAGAAISQALSMKDNEKWEPSTSEATTEITVPIATAQPDTGNTIENEANLSSSSDQNYDTSVNVENDNVSTTYADSSDNNDSLSSDTVSEDTSDLSQDTSQQISNDSFVDAYTESSIDESSSELSKEEVDQYVHDIWFEGKYGNGQDRKDALGDNYNQVQTAVNEYVAGTYKLGEVENDKVASVDSDLGLSDITAISESEEVSL